MSNATDRSEMPEELRELGEMRHVYDSTQSSLLASLMRGVFPIAVAGVMVVIGEIWLVPRTWKYYLLVGIAFAMLLNGVRVIVQTYRRRNQKVVLFEHGVAIWRNDVLTTYRYEQIEEVDATYARGDNGTATLLSFAVVCSNSEEKKERIRFDPAGDPIKNLEGLCQELEQRVSQTRIPAARAALEQGQELWFGKQVWGKYVDTKVGVSLRGLHLQTRHGSMEFLDWSNAASIKMEAGLFVVHEKTIEGDWLSLPAVDFPGFLTLVAAAEHAWQNHLAIVEQLTQERLPARLAELDSGQEIVVSNIAFSTKGMRNEAGFNEWHFASVEIQYDELLIEIDTDHTTEKRNVSIDQLPLADRVLLWKTLEYAQDNYQPSQNLEKTHDDAEMLKHQQ